jgi:hypothetical protein
MKGTDRNAAMRAVQVATFSLAISACIYDGSYLVRGTVLGARDGREEPIAGAVVSVSAKEGESRVMETTSADGTFELEYRWGGMMPFTWGDGDPRLRVRADGYVERDVKLDGEMPDGVSQRPCELGRRGCRNVEILLAPAPSS